MAANTKGKRKVKGKTLDLNTFLGEDADAPSGYAVVQPRRMDWADVMDNEDVDDRFTLDYKKDEKLVLPTAPKAARGPDVDLAKVPSNPPFTAFLGNLPYDVSEDDIVFFFRQLEVKNVRLPRENGEKGRIRGFGYAEFNNRQDLIQALALNNESMKNRALKISLAGEHDGDRGGDRRDAGPDRTLGDWRSSDRQTAPRDDSRNDSRGGYSDREPYRAKSGYDRPFERNDRNDRNERNGDSFNRSDFGTRNQDRDYGSRNQDRDYGGRNDRDFGGRDQDRRGYGFSDRGGNRGGRSDSRDYGGSFGRREDSGRDSRYRDSDRDPPRDSYDRRPAERPSYDSGSSSGKERPRLQLAPRTKPIEPVPPPAEAVAASSIFGGAKPVDTAAKEREIEARLAREKDVVKDPKEKEPEARVRKFSSGSGISNRSRRSSDSGPGSASEDAAPHYKPPIPKQGERETTQPYTLPRTRQRCGSNSSTGSDRDQSTKENYNRSDNSNDVPRPHGDDSSKSDFRKARNNHSHRDNSRERALHGTTYEEPKAPVYTSANKFSYLKTDAEDLDPGSD
ncbi:hypothetical protein JTE90_002831 [Oedothorax gibbosus]|uniref:RRM domain-containing protein n=1 Tax=Oedothorax gibbosus TaxID=931172 RepID=A0AAV6U7G0_9ARAC|nr:hypothetical protein JTE90_002831 [Oedothorax gibbosus]